MYAKIILRFVFLWPILTVLPSVALAQADETIRQSIDRINLSTITIVGGGIDSTSARLARDMGSVLNDGDKRRVLPVLSTDAVQIVSDVLHLRGVDIGLVHEDALNAIGENEVFPDVQNRLLHIARFSHDNVYVVASGSYTDIGQLAGNTVNFGPGSPSPFTTPALLFQAHGIDVEAVNLDHVEAIEDIKSGRIAATVIVGGNLDSIIAGVGPGDGLRLLSVPLPAGNESYAPVTLTAEDFPKIIPAATSLDTVAVNLIMIVNNWPSSHPRYQKVDRFVESLFARFEEFHEPARHAKWQEVNLAAQVPNWRKFPPATRWLARYEQVREDSVAKLQNSFDSFLENRNDKKELTDAERQAMYEQFLNWPNNPVETEFNIRLTSADGIGEKIGTILVRNTEIVAGGRKEAALMIRPNLKGLRPGRYAFHVHENPECGSGEKDGQAVAGMAAGGHLWLAGTGSLRGQVFGSHLGDLPDLVADADGTATQEVVVARLSLADVVNRAVMVHANEDDASPRMACGVIR